MFQQQQTLWSDDPCEVSRMARRALGALRADLLDGTEDDAWGVDTLRSPSRDRRCHDPVLADHLYEASLCSGRDAISAAVRDLQGAGLSNYEIKVDYVPLVARRLGDDWVNDVASFGAVTIGCSRLQSLVRHLENDPSGSGPSARDARRNCLVVVPKDQHHTLGAVILTEELRHAGSDAQLAIGVDAAEMGRLTRAQDLDAVMISAALGESTDLLSELVHAARARAPRSKILIGGGLLGHRTDLIAVTGADYVTNNAQMALDLCAPGCCLTRDSTADVTAAPSQTGFERRALIE